MRIVMLLVALMVIGLIVAQALNQKPSAPPMAEVQQSAAASPTPPTVPTRPQDLKALEQGMNRFIQDAARQRAIQEPGQ